MYLFAGYAAYFLQLLHQIIFGVQPAGGVDDQDVGLTGLAGADGVVDYRSWVGPRLVMDNVHPYPFAPDFELVYSRGPESVRRPKDDLFALSLVITGQFSDGGGLTRTVNPDYQNDG